MTKHAKRTSVATNDAAEITGAEFFDASIDIVGPSGNLSAVLFREKQGFNPLFRAVNLANRFDLMIISTKGVSVTAARKLIDEICGDHDLPLFVLHDFDVAGFPILGTLQRDSRRYQFSSAVEVVDLGLRLADIAGLAREPAVAVRAGFVDLSWAPLEPVLNDWVLPKVLLSVGGR